MGNAHKRYCITIIEGTKHYFYINTENVKMAKDIAEMQYKRLMNDGDVTVDHEEGEIDHEIIEASVL